MFLLLIKLIGSSEIPAFQIPSEAVVNTLVTMALVFFAILLYNLARIHLTKPIELIHGGQIGEKEPKTKILLTIIGVLTMGAAPIVCLQQEALHLLSFLEKTKSFITRQSILQVYLECFTE